MKLSWGFFGDKSITVYASKVAVAADLHPYQNRDDLQNEYNFHAFGEKPTEEYEADPQVAERKAIDSLPSTVRERVLTAIDQGLKAGSVKDVGGVIGALAKDREVPRAVTDMVRSKVYTQYGASKEDSVREGLSSSVTKTNAFKTRPWFTLSNGIPVVLGGRHDGYDAINNRVVEIKVRQRRFLSVPEYERVQVHSYMHIFDTHRITLIEHYNGEEREHNVMYDSELWHLVTNNVKSFMESLIVRPGNDGRDDGDDDVKVPEGAADD